jgi:dethiobiotin synthetase
MKEMAMSYEKALAEQRTARAHRQRREGVEYKLRVIEGSGGLLELVEKQPQRRSWFHDWARAMQFSGWGL